MYKVHIFTRSRILGKSSSTHDSHQYAPMGGYEPNRTEDPGAILRHELKPVVHAIARSKQVCSSGSHHRDNFPPLVAGFLHHFFFCHGVQSRESLTKNSNKYKPNGIEANAVSRDVRACVACESKRGESRGMGGRCQARSPANFWCSNVAGASTMRSLF